MTKEYETIVFEDSSELRRAMCDAHQFCKLVHGSQVVALQSGHIIEDFNNLRQILAEVLEVVDNKGVRLPHDLQDRIDQIL